MDEKPRDPIEALNELKANQHREFWTSILGLGSVLFSLLKWGLPGLYISIAILLLLAFTFEGLRRWVRRENRSRDPAHHDREYRA
jgi:hypothetical protein